MRDAQKERLTKQLFSHELKAQLELPSFVSDKLTFCPLGGIHGHFYARLLLLTKCLSVLPGKSFLRRTVRGTDARTET
jgi:hypothetical protein